jgi:hypothetical protein
MGWEHHEAYARGIYASKQQRYKLKDGQGGRETDKAEAPRGRADQIIQKLALSDLRS